MQNLYTDNLRRILREADDFSVVCEIYPSDAAPPFDPNTAVKRYAATGGIAFLGAAYDRLIRSFGSIRRTITAEVNSCSVDFDNLDRQISQFELAGTGFEGLVKVIRLISRSQSALLSDSYIIFVGRCEKPKSGNREKMSLSTKHVLGGTDVELPRRKFTKEDVEGRHPSDPLFEGFIFQIQYGSVSYSVREKRGGFLGLLGFKKTVTKTLAYSSYSDLDASKSVPETFGRTQIIGTHLGYRDVGTNIQMLTAFCEGAIEDFYNTRSVTPGFDLNPNAYSEQLGELGGVGTQTIDPNWVAPGYYSRTANVRCNAFGSSVQQQDPAPDVVSVVFGRRVDLPDAANGWSNFGWSDDPAAQIRFMLTSPDFYKLAASWINDESFTQTFIFNNEIIFDASYSDTLFAPESFSGAANYTPGGGAAVGMSLLRSTATASPQYFDYLNKDKSVTETFFQTVKMSEYNSENIIEFPDDPDDPGGGGGGNPTANLFFFLRRRYVSNVVVTEPIKLIDFFHQVMFPAARLFFSQAADGRIKLNSKKPVDFALSTSFAANDTLNLDDVSKWVADKSGQLLIDPNTNSSEVRAVTGANYSLAQNNVLLSTSANITISRAFSGGDGASNPAYARLTVASVEAGNFVNLDGTNIPFTAADGDTLQTIAGFIYGVINGHPTLRRKFVAAWTPGTTIVDVTAKFGTLTLNANLEKTHSAPLADPTTAPVPAAASGACAAGIYTIAYAYQNERGQTLLSPFETITLTANQNISVGTIALPAGATNISWYCSPAANSKQLRLVKQNSGAAFVIDSLPKVSAPVPPDFNRTGAEVLRVAQVFSDRAETRSNISRSNVLKATFEWQPERKNPINQIELTFRDSTQDFRLSRIILRDDAHIARTKKVSKTEVNGQAIDSYHQAYRIASGLLAENRDADFFYRWAADREALLLEEGSVVSITDDSSGVYNLPVRIEQIDVSVEKGFPKATFTARKYSTTLYDDSVAERQIPVIVENPVSNFGGGSPPDADTTAYMNALGIPNDGTMFYSGTPQAITGANIWTAVNNFVGGLKTNNLWAKTLALYPMIGGTAERHKFNLKNPANTDAANRLGWFGTWVHSATGALPDGATAYANTFFSSYPADNLSLAYEARNYTSMRLGTFLGAFNGASQLAQIVASDGNLFFDSYDVGNGRTTNTSNNFTGFLLGNRLSNNAAQIWRNGTIVATSSSGGGTPPTNPLLLGAIDVGSLAAFSNQECAFASIGSGLTDTEATNLYNLVQALQTALFRQV